MENCKFCDIAQRKTDDYIIWENDKFVAFLDIFPAKLGHCLLIPKEHIDYFFDLEDELYKELMITAKKLSDPLKKATNAERVGIAVVGFDIPHAHLHLIPLHGPNELFDPRRFYKAAPGELKNMQLQLAKLLENYK